MVESDGYFTSVITAFRYCKIGVHGCCACVIRALIACIFGTGIHGTLIVVIFTAAGNHSQTQYEGKENDGTHGHVNASPGDSAHRHDVLIPEKMRQIKPGDRVLVAWVGNDAVVLDIVLPGTEVK